VVKKLKRVRYDEGHPWKVEADFRFDEAPGPAQERPKVFIELIDCVLALPIS
jgi:hypothetical protein